MQSNVGFYFWCFNAGLKGLTPKDVEAQAILQGRTIRPKDWENYTRGRYKEYSEPPSNSLDRVLNPYLRKDNLSKYPLNAWYPMNVYDRWVPCIKTTPLVKWSQVRMVREDAECYRNATHLAENLKDGKFIYIDCDASHDKDHIDIELHEFLKKYQEVTEYWINEEDPYSYHLAFVTNRLIPTQHFLHMDVLGNYTNSLRYLKDKQRQGGNPIMLTHEIWKDIISFIERRHLRGEPSRSDSKITTTDS